MKTYVIKKTCMVEVRAMNKKFEIETAPQALEKGKLIDGNLRENNILFLTPGSFGPVVIYENMSEVLEERKEK